MKYLAAIYALSWGMLLLWAPSAQPLELKVITEDWAPYNYEENGVLTGFSVEIVQAIMVELEESHKIAIYPGARGESMLDNLPNIMSFSLFRTPERENRYKWIGPISIESIYFYKRKNDLRIFKTLSDIKKVDKIAVPHKGLILSYVEAQGITNIYKMLKMDAQIRHVLMGRADLAVTATPLGVAHYLKKLNKPTDALVKTQVKLLEFPLYIACSRKIPDSVIDRWQQAFEKVKASGKFQRIYNKYLY